MYIYSDRLRVNRIRRLPFRNGNNSPVDRRNKSLFIFLNLLDLCTILHGKQQHMKMALDSIYSSNEKRTQFSKRNMRKSELSRSINFSQLQHIKNGNWTFLSNQKSYRHLNFRATPLIKTPSKFSIHPQIGIIIDTAMIWKEGRRGETEKKRHETSQFYRPYTLQMISVYIAWARI